MNGIFWSVQEGTRTVFHISLDPFPFENYDGFGGLRMAVSGNHGAGGKFPEQESGSIGRIMG